MRDFNTPLGLLDYLLQVNKYGVWFVRVHHDNYIPLPRWLWVHCSLCLPDKKAMYLETDK